MKSLNLLMTAAILVAIFPAAAEAQLQAQTWHAAPAAATPFAVEATPVEASKALADLGARRISGINPLIRTLGTVLASTGGYAAGDASFEPDLNSEVKYYPIAAGAAASAVTGILLSNANPFRVIMGSALAVLPSAALSTFLDGSLTEADKGSIPLIAFGIPHGLLTSAFAQNRR